MNKLDLAARLAKELHGSPAKVADAVDTLVHSMHKDLKRHSGPSARTAQAERHNSSITLGSEQSKREQ
jgi:hypothetical protein